MTTTGTMLFAFAFASLACKHARTQCYAGRSLISIRQSAAARSNRVRCGCEKGCMRNEDGIDRWTLKFKSPGLETGFMLSRYQRLSEWTTILIILVLANCAFYSLAHNFWNPDQYPTDAAVSASKWQAMIFLGGTAVVEVMMLVSKTLACSHKPLRNVVLYMEFTMTVCCVIMMVVTVGMNRHYLARILGHDDAEAVWGRDLGYVDGLNLIIINLCAQCAHLAPIRWAVLLLPQVLSA